MQSLYSLNKHKKAVPYSFRVSEEWIEILREEANRTGLKVNALVNVILQKYCRYWKWVEHFDLMLLPRPILAELMACYPEDAIPEFARVRGSIGMKDAFRTIGLFPTHDKVMHFIQNEMALFGNWFNVTQYTRGRKDCLHLRHMLGRNWSVFISELISATFEQILNEKVTSEISDGFVTLYIST